MYRWRAAGQHLHYSCQLAARHTRVALAPPLQPGWRGRGHRSSWCRACSHRCAGFRCHIPCALLRRLLHFIFPLHHFHAAWRRGVIIIICAGLARVCAAVVPDASNLGWKWHGSNGERWSGSSSSSGPREGRRVARVRRLHLQACEMATRAAGAPACVQVPPERVDAPARVPSRCAAAFNKVLLAQAQQNLCALGRSASQC